MRTAFSARPPAVHSRARGRRRLVVAALLAAVVAAVAVVAIVQRDRDPFGDRPLYTWPGSAAAEAATDLAGADAQTLERIAQTPTAVWLTPEAHPRAEVGRFVADVVADADGESIPVFVVYGIPDRDCSGAESSGGLPAEDYLDWVEAIAAPLDDGSAVVLEPDALATLGECADADERVDLLSAAVGVLDAGPVTYVDAGHANWVDATTMAERLAAVGVERVRGFATNVANYQSTSDEITYATQVADALAGADGDRPHFVIDTGRNGNGSSANWCNPDGRALGSPPAAGNGEADGLDATLWVKPPGESDGTCGGGPPAGEFWTARALEMAAAAGW